MRRGGDFSSYLHFAKKFLGDLTTESYDFVLAWFHLSAGELPPPRQLPASTPLHAVHKSIADDDCPHNVGSSFHGLIFLRAPCVCARRPVVCQTCEVGSRL